MLTSRLYGGSPTTSWSPRKIRPSVGSSKPPIIRSVVVFPQPDGPSSAKNEPRGISTEIPSTATVSSNRLTTFSSLTSGSRLRCSSSPASFTQTCLIRVYSSIE